MKGEMKRKVLEEVRAANPGSKDHTISNIYENFLGGTLIAVTFKMNDGKDATNHVLLATDTVTVYRVFHDVCSAVSSYKERRWFFRLLEFAGMGGVIGLTLVIIFSILLSILALWGKDANPSLIEIVKISFTMILGYFFGSQTTKR